MSIEIKIEELQSRVSLVRNLLSPLRGEGKTLPCDIYPHQYNGCKVISAHDGITRVENFEKRHFKTYIKDIMCQYYELWKLQDGHRKLVLNQAYLNVFLINEKRDLEKVVSIHCDPYLEGDDLKTTYKRGPHLHVQKADDPLPKCHFPLSLIELDKILSSLNNLTIALKKAVEIVRNEVLERYLNLN